MVGVSFSVKKGALQPYSSLFFSRSLPIESKYCPIFWNPGVRIPRGLLSC